VTLDFYDTFSRTSNNEFGTSDSGHDWEHSRLIRRYNWFPNPSFEVSALTTNPTATGPATISRVSDGAGQHVMQMSRAVSTAGVRLSLIYLTPYTGSTPFSGRLKVRMPTGMANRNVFIRVYSMVGGVNTPDGPGALNGWASQGTITGESTITQAWTEFVFDGWVSGVTCDNVGIEIRSGSANPPLSGEAVWLDHILIEKTSASGSYFDGSYSGASWDGTAHLSTSTLNQNVSGPSTDFHVDGESGLMMVGAPEWQSGATVQGISADDVDWQISGAVAPTPTGDAALLAALVRVVPGEYAGAFVSVAPGGTATLSIRDHTGQLASGALPFTPGTAPFRVRVRASGAFVSAKAWADGVAEPLDWQLTAETTHLDSGSVGVSGSLGASVSNAPALFYVYEAIASDAITGTRIEDTFSRTVSDGLGPASSGQTWDVASGAETQYDVTGSHAEVTLPTESVYDGALIGEEAADVDVRISVRAPSLTTGAAGTAGLLLRSSGDMTDALAVGLRFNTDQTVTLRLIAIESGSATEVTSVATAFTHAEASWYTIRVRALGASVRAKAWLTTSGQPGAWAIDEEVTFLDPGAIGVYGVKATGNTNSPLTMYFDDLNGIDLTPGILTEFNGEDDSPGIRLTLENADAYDRVRVTRIDTSGVNPPVTVRGLDSVAIPFQLVTVTDYEAPLNTPLVYRLIGLDEDNNVVASVESEPSEIPSPYHVAIVKSVGKPAMSRRISVIEFPGFSRSVRVLQKAEVLGRAAPIILWDVMKGMTGTVRMSSHDVTADPVGSDLRRLFQDGGVLYFQSTTQATGIPDFYLVAETVDYARENVVKNQPPVYVYTVGFEEVSRPPTASESLGFFSFQTLIDAGHADFESVNDTFGSFLDLLNFTNRPPAGSV
jgi:hypothetical protein